ncbi:TIGR03545 family protein [Simiduia curdlanivorans]|uniref:TIGR03545 family protein n=1 Tax=Simiduia curdlanivorans TaxID=1492769 RepID=A0ABV8V0R5_9GAMM|nr:TIGR03545 family protein [Simiduia curdlanivorans]MDN3640369.1 TIGR03545 family protein [Simiduia curdlanivorans]
MIRKSGWLVLLSMLVVVSLSVVLFAGRMIKFGMVSALEEAVQAEVNVDSVSLNFAPLGLEIVGLQITDRANPTHNSVSFARAAASLELWPALLGYWIVDELSVDGMAYGLARKSPGEVYHRAEKDEEAKQGFTVGAQDLPDQDELIARMDLKTPVKAQALADVASEEMAALGQLQNQLPSEAQLKQYEAQIKALTDSKIKDANDLAKKTEELKAIKAQLEQEQAKLKQLSKQIVASKNKQQQALAELKAASDSDWDKAQQLANLSDGGLAGIAQILLGEAWAGKLAQVQALYAMVEPYLDQGGASGKTQADETAGDEQVLPNRLLPLPHQPYPDFLIKQANVSWLMAGGEVAMKAKNITAQHALINSPTTFTMQAANLPKLKAFNLNGELAILDQLKSKLTWALSDYGFEQLALGSGNTSLQLLAGSLTSEGSLALLGDQITQKSNFTLLQPTFEKVGGDAMAQLVDVLNKQQTLPFAIAASGSIEAPKVRVSSSLDKLFADAVSGKAKEKIAQYQSSLKEKFEQKYQAALANQGDWAAQISAQSSQVDSVESSIEELLSAQLAGVESQAKDKLKDSLLKKMGGN